ncbi:MAG: site-specific integrase [Oscillospiraceae bacterium]|nr:site-specific integrase [Oscillospiraceae bacterium]
MAYIQARFNKKGELLHYRLFVSDGLDWTGRQRRRYKIWTPDKPGMSQKQMEKAALAAAIKFEEEIRAGYEVDKRKKFHEYAEYVMDLKSRTGLSPTTIERYRSMLPRIYDGIGHMKLTDIRPYHLNDLYKHLAENGIRNKGAIATAKKVVRKKVAALKLPKCAIVKEAGFSQTTLNAILRGNSVTYANAEKLATYLGYSVSELFVVEDKFKPLSDKTILEHHRLISMIMALAEKELLVPYNPAAKATPPKVSKKEADYFQPEEVMEIVKALEDVPIKWKAMAYILIDTGCRRGELMGLQWSNVDLDKGIMIIKQALLYTKAKGVYVGPPKTGRPRAVCLAPETITVLKKWKTEQLRTKILHGNIWQDTGFVFTKDDGTVMHPDSITDWLNKFSEANDLPHIHPHAFRHTVASILISNGIDPVTTANELGHANANTTQAIYAHQIARARAEASGVRAGVFSVLREA